MQCPCGSDISFNQCCFLIINQELIAQSPEQLMRSRYSAYATKAVDYIYQTYTNSSRALQSKSDISVWANDTKWLKLIVHSASDYTFSRNEHSVDVANNEHSLPTVSFSAFYLHQGAYFLMKETSRFMLEDNQWRYLDGKVSRDEEFVTPKRNQLCFCLSNKKFKHCCGK